MVFEFQPDIIVNNRNGLPGDFATPEQEIHPAKDGRAWETCMTLNESWGYQKADTTGNHRKRSCATYPPARMMPEIIS